MRLSIGKAAAVLGVSVSTLRRWESDGSFLPTFRTSGGHRRYELNHLESKFRLHDSSNTPKPSHTLAYARRFGADLVLELCYHFGVEVIMLESPAEQSFETELAADVIELMTVFSTRSHQNRKRQAA